MAQFEKGKGARKRTVTLTQLGALVTKDEIDGPSEMLTGYLRCGSEAAARAELIRESIELITAGLAPVDDAAREIAALVPKKPKVNKLELPIRKDVYVYNEATGMMLTSRQMAGRGLEEGSKKWSNAIQKGELLPLSLIQDDPFTVRVVVGGKLEPAEAEEWVARIDWHLNVKDGRLCVTGGAPLVSSDYEKDDPYCDQFIREINIPKGHYRVSLYSYVPGINGKAVLDHLAGGYDRFERLGKWFRRTRGGEEFPLWLKDWCAGDPTIDPGHEADWAGVPLLAEEDWPDYVHFLAHLEPVKSRPRKDLSPPPTDGWFGEAVNARVPERCPRGLEGREVTGQLSKRSGDWLFAHDPFKKSASREAVSISGGPVSLPVKDACLVFRLCWFSTRWSMYGLRATLPTNGVAKLDLSTPEGVVVYASGREIQFAFSADLDSSNLVRTLADLGALLDRLPDGTMLEAVSVPPENLPMPNPETGFHRYIGTIRGGSWELERTYPRLDRRVLDGAIALSREVSVGETIAISDPDEGKAIVAFTKRNFDFHFEGNSMQLDGGHLRLKKHASELLELCGIGAFAVRYGTVWPVVDLDEDDDDDDEDEFGATTGDPWDLEEHVKGPEVYRDSSGRVYHQTMALLTSAALEEKVRAEERKLKGAKFRHVADIVCAQLAKVAVHAYAQPSGAIWALFHLTLPNTVVFELSSRFADGATLITGREPGVDERASNIHRRFVLEGTVKELLAEHEACLLELEAAHGKPLPLVQSALGLAEWMSGLKR